MEMTEKNCIEIKLQESDNLIATGWMKQHSRTMDKKQNTHMKNKEKKNKIYISAGASVLLLRVVYILSDMIILYIPINE